MHKPKKLYKCERCDYTTNRKSSIRTHINRKNKCSKSEEKIQLEKILPIKQGVINNLKCQFCNKIFTHSRSIYKHIKNCKVKKEKESENDKNLQIEKLKVLNKSLELKNIDLISKLEKKENELLIEKNKNLILIHQIEKSILCGQIEYSMLSFTRKKELKDKLNIQIKNYEF